MGQGVGSWVGPQSFLNLRPGVGGSGDGDPGVEGELEEGAGADEQELALLVPEDLALKSKVVAIVGRRRLGGEQEGVCPGLGEHTQGICRALWTFG